MPPLGIDRFNFVCGDPGLEIVGGLVEAWDQGNVKAPCHGSLVPHVPGCDVGFLDTVAFPVSRFHVRLDVARPGATPLTYEFRYDLMPKLPLFWIAYVTVGVHGTPHGDPPFHVPFGQIEIVNGKNVHRQVLLARGPDIVP